MRKRILVMGTVAMDTVMDVAALPGEDGFAHIKREHITAGGSSANVSVALKGMGAQVYQSGKIGDDDFGRIFREDLKAHGINDDYLITRDGGITLHTYIAVDPQGRHFIMANSGNCVMNLEPEDIPDELFDRIDLFYTDMASHRAGLHIAKICSKRGIPVIFNLQNPPEDLLGKKMKSVQEVLAYTSLFITGRATICETMRNPDKEEALRQFLNCWTCPDGHICTCGSAGAVWYAGQKSWKCGIAPVQSVDTTGAGDSYIAGIIYAYYCLGKTREDSMRYAAAAAALKCTQSGPRLCYDAVQMKRLEEAVES